MLPNNARGIEASLRGIPGVKDVKVEGKSLKAFIQETLAEQIALARKNKLTWRKGEIDAPHDPKKKIGKLRTDRPYVGPLGRGRWYVQNMRVFTSAGQPLKNLDIVSNEPIEELVADRTGKTQVVKFRSDLEQVKEALTLYAKAAATNDPNLCPYCFAYSNADRKQMSAHIFKLHPKEFQAEMAEADANAPEDELPPPQPHEAPEVVAE